MNVDWGDFDNDGRLDIYVTDITDEYIDWGSGPKFFDYDKGGCVDLWLCGFDGRGIVVADFDNGLYPKRRWISQGRRELMPYMHRLERRGEKAMNSATGTRSLASWADLHDDMLKLIRYQILRSARTAPETAVPFGNWCEDPMISTNRNSVQNHGSFRFGHEGLGL